MTCSSITQEIFHPLWLAKNIQVFVKRDDDIHPIISGNKWRKLKFNLKHIQKTPKLKGALSFGGSYSNHIHAFAFACFQENIPCVGIIRGEADNINNYTLAWAKHWGMKLHFVDRKTYRRRQHADFIAELENLYPNYFIIPEGGSNKLAIPGVAEVITELNQQVGFDTILTPVGSGGTLAGLITGDSLASNKQHKILGVAVLKGADYLRHEIQKLLPEHAKSHNNWQLLTGYHCGGYAKFSDEDSEKIIEFNKLTGVDFEPIYSGKMILTFLKLLKQGYFETGERIVLLHTGGLQGLGGMIERGILNKSDWPAFKPLTSD
jgi:1-aminocyclopropane-1-carboxylate deaminase